MHRLPIITIALLLCFWPAATGLSVATSAETPAEKLKEIEKEFNAQGYALRQSKTDEEREEAVTQVSKLTARLLELAEQNPKQPIAMDALVQVVIHEMWMENNTPHLGKEADSPAGKAIETLIRDHLQSEKAGEACRRMSYGFRKECETFIRAVLKSSPHADVRGLACLRLAQFLNARLQRLELLQVRPEMAQRYAGLFGQNYLDALRQQDRSQVFKEIKVLFEQAAEKYADVKLPYGGTVGTKAKSELYEIRNLTVGKPAPDFEGDDQEGEHFKLSDYREKVVLVYFWSEY
ncbi:MAG: peroxiredoxin family protein [Planctomycetales bacterium]|nr:peroxiredoxin family protein [Planctomycetales bacterium]